MYAIVEISGKQFIAEQGKTLKVPYQNGEVGTNISFDRVLLLSKNGTTKFGSPVVKGACVDAELVSHGRGKKIIVFKFKRRKGYQKKQGHRQDFSTIRIQKIINK